jgi:glycine/D-amino acid oxidase-like deaminating enzyme
VVGAGIAGSSVARVLRERGHEVVLISAGRPHSLAATAVLRRGWHHQALRDVFDLSLYCYGRWGIRVDQGGLVTSWRRPGELPLPERDWASIDPAAPLLPPDVTGAVETMTSRRVLVAGGPAIDADAVVCCAGASALSQPGRISWGVTWEHDDPEAVAPPPLRVHHAAPYKTIFAGVFRGPQASRARIGSSTAPDLNRARRHGEDLLAMAIDLGWTASASGWRPVAGARHHADTNATRRGGIWHLAGLARTGYALAPGWAMALAGHIEHTLATERTIPA